MNKIISKKGKRCGNISQEQKKAFIELMEAAEDLRKGKFHPLFTYKDSQRQWKKDWIHWRRTWQDMKKIIQKKNTEIKKHATSTGGGPPTNILLSKEEEDLLQILDKTGVEGDEEVEESQVNFIGDNHNFAVESNVEITEIVEDENHEKASDIGGNEVISEAIDVEINKRKNKPEKRKNRRPIATQRLEYSLEANENLSRIAAENVDIKRKYYEKKIEILKENVLIGNRIATALENISQFLQNEQE